MEEQEVTECKIKKCLCSKPVLIVLACLLCFFIGYYSGYSSAKKTIPNKPRVTAPGKRIPRNIPNISNRKLPPPVKPTVKQPATIPTNITKPKTTTKQNVATNTAKAQTKKTSNTTTNKTK